MKLKHFILPIGLFLAGCNGSSTIRNEIIKLVPPNSIIMSLPDHGDNYIIRAPDNTVYYFDGSPGSHVLTILIPGNVVESKTETKLEK